ncbi:hypothetical protein E2C01_078903 [Portunus trituberculatus]|uniref:Uncharacterized protein n=1 Tax=Portunus trituberculatus TaxID=210409 RepID=A0A5B7INX9_PORTR|nr:hypothetical protein [Portunus trituberculatus]
MAAVGRRSPAALTLDPLPACITCHARHSCAGRREFLISESLPRPSNCALLPESGRPGDHDCLRPQR